MIVMEMVFLGIWIVMMTMKIFKMTVTWMVFLEIWIVMMKILF